MKFLEHLPPRQSRRPCFSAKKLPNISLLELWPQTHSRPTSVLVNTENPAAQFVRDVMLAMDYLSNCLDTSKNEKVENEDHQGFRVSAEKAHIGRHGDIKPENLLWRTDSVSSAILFIPDLGLNQFNYKQSRSVVSPFGLGGLQTYIPPEPSLLAPVSRSYDIWTACLYLEFIIWVLPWERDPQLDKRFGPVKLHFKSRKRTAEFRDFNPNNCSDRLNKFNSWLPKRYTNSKMRAAHVTIFRYDADAERHYREVHYYHHEGMPSQMYCMTLCEKHPVYRDKVCHHLKCDNCETRSKSQELAMIKARLKMGNDLFWLDPVMVSWDNFRNLHGPKLALLLALLESVRLQSSTTTGMIFIQFIDVSQSLLFKFALLTDA